MVKMLRLIASARIREFIQLTALFLIAVAAACSKPPVRAGGATPGASAATSDAIKAFAARSWRITSTTLRPVDKSSSTKGGDQGILAIDGDRFLILDANAHVDDQGRFEPRGGRHVRFRNLSAVMELEIHQSTPAEATLEGTVDFGGTETPVRYVLAAMSTPAVLPSPENLHSAAALGDAPAIGRLLAAGKGVNSVKDGLTPLMVAAGSCHPAAVGKLLDGGADVNAVSADGKTALIFATECGDLDTVNALIAKKATVRIRRRQDQESPLLIAADDGRVDLVQVLLAAGADANDKDQYGNGLLCVATKGVGLGNREAPELVAFLLENKANPNERGQNGVTPLMNALLFKQQHAIPLLLSHGADPKLTDGGDRPTTEYAQGNPALLKLLPRTP
ncbi:MAG: ankyrin repeat domain-containing protein [Polyangia bacterium]